MFLKVALLALLASAAQAGRTMERSVMAKEATSSVLAKSDNKKKDKHPFSTPTGLFIQERASKQLPGPGQHFSFGALTTWDNIHAMLDGMPDAKLVLLVRHGQAISNYLSDALGPDDWFKWESKCAYTDGQNKTWGIFDADLTDLGSAEADALNSMLKDGGWFNTLTAGKPARAVVSPLSRCLQTATSVLKGLPLVGYEVEENVRETLGEDTCDARRAASDPPAPAAAAASSASGYPAGGGVCAFAQGLRSRFPQFSFPVVGTNERERTGLGLLADGDPLWTEERETQGHQTKRALTFLNHLFTFAPERVIFVVTHSGFTRSVLLAVGREPYRPQNTELVPLLLQRRQPEEAAAA